MNIAIDGPSGAGKSTIAKLLANKLKIAYLDTGAMYRAIGLYVNTNNVDPTDDSAVAKLLDSCKIDILYSEGTQKILLNGKDVSIDIRKNEISHMASMVAKNEKVRDAMVSYQRELAGKEDSVIDGRDIGTVVLPNATYKFFLTADVMERAKRRYLELKEKNIDCVLEDIARDVQKRDYEDINRKISPLKKSSDAIEIDSTSLTIEGVVDKIISYIKL